MANPIASPSVTTTYTVTVSDSFGSTPVTSSVIVTFVTPNPNLASVDFKQGSGTTCVGDTTLTGTTMKNAVGNLFTGQLGNWNALDIGTYTNTGGAITGYLKNGSGTSTTVKLAMGLATGLDSTSAGSWRCSPNEGAPGGADQLRSECAYLYAATSTADHYAWVISGLLPSSSYKLTFFGTGSNSTTSNVAFPGTPQQAAGVKDSENDWNWTSVTSDASGKISGTFTDPPNNGAAGLCGMQIEGPLPLALTASAGPAKSVSSITPSVTIGGSPTGTGGSGTYTYSWTPTTGLDDPTLANPTASPTVNTTYTVVVTDTATSNTASSSVTVTYVADAAYTTWAQTNITAINPSADASATGDPDGDGVSNLAEFAFHGDPLSGANNGYMVTAIEDTDADGHKELTLTVAVRDGAGSPTFTGSPSLTASVDGITYTIEGSLDLASFASSVSETAAPTGLPALPAGWEYRRFRLDASNGLPSIGFLRAKVTQP